jgi:hypothetical protein
MILLGIEEEIFGDFFKKLMDAKLPEDLIKELRTLVEKGEIGSKEKIIEVVKRGVGAGDEHQKH